MQSHQLPTLVLVTGMRTDVAEHWQSRLAASVPRARVVPSFERAKHDLAGRVVDLDGVVQEAKGPVTIVAHSAGVLTTVHWAARHDTGRVVGALLATPPDLATPLPLEYPSLDALREAGWLPIPRHRLRFPSIVAASSNDALGDPDNVRDLAGAWGSHVVDLGPVGHLNPASGYGEWPLAQELIDRIEQHALAEPLA